MLSLANWVALSRPLLSGFFPPVGTETGPHKGPVFLVLPEPFEPIRRQSRVIEKIGAQAALEKLGASALEASRPLKAQIFPSRTPVISVALGQRSGNTTSAGAEGRNRG